MIDQVVLDKHPGSADLACRDGTRTGQLLDGLRVEVKNLGSAL